ncbi:MAG: hypothetical protein E7565_07935 [Ruminococcaceae bacterium]|nr:hypothetical protein [Oscillospiraceae bacterium]
MEWVIKQPKKGDIIRTKVKFYHHYGIFVDEENIIQFGFRDNSGVDPETIEVLSTDIKTFCDGAPFETADLSVKEKLKRKSVKETVQSAQSALGQRGYNILHNNCEHFVNRCVFGEAQSSFLNNARDEIRAKLSKTKIDTK